MELDDATIMFYYSIYNPLTFSMLVLTHILLFKLFSLCLIFMDFFDKKRKNQFSIMLIVNVRLTWGWSTEQLALFTEVFN